MGRAFMTPLAGGVAALAALMAAREAAGADRVASPSGAVEIAIEADGSGPPRYSVFHHGRMVIAPSPLGLELERGGPLGPGARAVARRGREGEDRYHLLGRRAEVSKAWRELTLDLAEDGPEGRRLSLVLRAYDDGVAFRYSAPPQPGLDGVGVRGEATRFDFPRDYICWGLNLGRFDTSHEGEIDPVPASRIRPHNLYDAPLVCETGGEAGTDGGPVLAIAESDVEHWPALYLGGREDGGLGVQARLAPHPDAPGIVARTRIGSPVRSPWRVIMLADHAGGLIESTLITDLAPDPDFDASWVRPGRSAWDWWNGGVIEGVPGGSGMNTATFERYIDFAAANGLEYVTIDEGWYAGAGGGGTVAPGVDVTRTIAAIDLPHLVEYGRRRNVGLFLWLNWRALDAQMDEALAWYESLGIAGLKVDFMDRDDQQMVDWHHRLLRRTAAHRLLVNLHGTYHPTGMIRTYPHYLTQEGVLGAEYNKWSARVTAGHNVTVPYTRMVIGPIDYTPGGFRHVRPEDFEPRYLLPTVMTTRAHGLAMFVVYESPLTTVADTPDAYEGQPETAFLSAVPTVWDETRFLSGEIGRWIVLARRKGDDWFVGAMTDEQARSVRLPLDFLGDGAFAARIHADADAPDRTVIEDRDVSAADVLTLDLAPSGGAAVRIVPRER